MDKLIPRRETPAEEIRPVSVHKSNNAPLIPLKRIISPKHERVIIKKIFSKDKNAYESYVKTLESEGTWKEAYRNIQMEFTRRKIDQRDGEAIMFTNLVYRRYYPNDDDVNL